MALLLAALLGCSNAAQEPSLEERAQRLDRSLICPVCPGETIDQSQAALADQMQAVVREMLQAGRSEEQIRQFFVDRYGELVLAAPPKRGFNLVAWIVPPTGILGGFLVLALAVRAMRRHRPEAPDEVVSGTPHGLEPYLALVDRELQQGALPDPGARHGKSEQGGP